MIYKISAEIAKVEYKLAYDFLNECLTSLSTIDHSKQRFLKQGCLALMSPWLEYILQIDEKEEIINRLISSSVQEKDVLFTLIRYTCCFKN